MKQRRNTALCLPGGSALSSPLVSVTSTMCIFPPDYSVCQGSTAFVSPSWAMKGYLGLRRADSIGYNGGGESSTALDPVLPLSLQQGHLDPVDPLNFHWQNVNKNSYMSISTIFTQARSVFYLTLSCFNILRSFLFSPISSPPNDISQPQRHPTDTHHASFHFCPTVKQLRPIW